jgi:hypothetical protein
MGWGDLNPLVILHREKDEAKGNEVLILNAKKKKNEKDQHPKQCPDPPHLLILLSGLSFLLQKSLKAE